MTASTRPSSRDGTRAFFFSLASGTARPPLLRFALAFALVVVIAGCTTASPPTSSDPGAIASPLATARATGSPMAADFPLTVVDDEGTSVQIAERPARIVSLTPANTEVLFALGAGNRVVATTDADDYPPEAVPLPDVASFGAVDVEGLVELEPDLVLAGGNGFTPPDAIALMRDVDIPVVVVYAPSVDAVLEDVKLIGASIGAPSEAAALADAMRSEIEAIADATADLPRPRVFYEIDASAALFGPSDDSFLAEMIELAGGEPITTGSSASFEIDLERLVAADPEVIVLGDAAFGVTPDDVSQRPAWQNMTAVRSGAIRATDDKLVTRPGPRLPLGLRSLVLAIHPDARLP